MVVAVVMSEGGQPWSLKDICKSFGREREKGRFKNVLEGLVLDLCLSWVWKREREKERERRRFENV